jgi:hypothetical protein
MKKTLFIIFVLGIVFSSCEEENDPPQMDAVVFIRFPKNYENANFDFKFNSTYNESYNHTLITNHYYDNNYVDRLLNNYKGKFNDEFAPDNEIIIRKQFSFELDDIPFKNIFYDINIKVKTIDDQDCEYNIRVYLANTPQEYQEYLIAPDNFPLLFYYNIPLIY